MQVKKEKKLGGKKWQFSNFQAEKNKSELKQKGHKPSRAELKILQLKLWFKPARLGLITNILNELLCILKIKMLLLK